MRCFEIYNYKIMNIKQHDIHFGTSPELIERAKIFRKTPTHAELLLWNGLKNRQLSGYKFRRQHPINRFIADFFCYEVKLFVEIDGKIHQLPLNYEHDIGRTIELERFGMHIIRFTNDQVENDLDFVLNIIKQTIFNIKDQTTYSDYRRM